MDEEPSKLPLEIQKACRILGIAETELTTAKIIKVWKAAMIENYPSYETKAVSQNMAKDILLRWVQRFD